MNLKERLYRFRSFWIFPAIAAALLATAFRLESESSTTNVVWLFPLGLLVWTLLEYGLHRFVFHIQIPMRNLRLKGMLNASHMEHHAEPRNPDKVLVRPGYALVISFGLGSILYSMTGSLMTTAILLSGVWTGFLYYEAVHYRVHFSLSPSGLVARQRRAHFYHHFTNNRRCFGVTSSLWDYVFKTELPHISPLK